MATLILAIDFGTTTTVVCGDISGVGNPRFLVDDSSVLIPSVIFKRNDGVTFYGKEAEAESIRPKANGKLIENFKMWLLEEHRRQEGETYVKEFLREHIYKRLYINQKADFPEHDNIIVRISHPSKWSKDLVLFMANAIKESGFQNSKIETVAEPLAVSVYSMQSRAKSLLDVLQKNTSYNTMTIDMGGGTCDVVICKTEIDEEGRCHVSASAAYPTSGSSESCGGKDIDFILMHYIWKQCQLHENLRRIFTQRNARIWKEQVSKELKRNEVADAPARVCDILSTLNIDMSSQGSIDRSTFENESSQHWRDFRKIIQDAVKDYQSNYNVAAKEIDFIFVTGGHSQWYCVKDEILKSCNFEKISKNQNRFIDGSECNPNETVARGLCAYDAKLVCGGKLGQSIWARLIVNNNTNSYSYELKKLFDKDERVPIKGKQIVFEGYSSTDKEKIPAKIEIFWGEDENHLVLNKILSVSMDLPSLRVGDVLLFAFKGTGIKIHSVLDISIDLTREIIAKARFTANRFRYTRDWVDELNEYPGAYGGWAK